MSNGQMCLLQLTKFYTIQQVLAAYSLCHNEIKDPLCVGQASCKIQEAASKSFKKSWILVFNVFGKYTLPNCQYGFNV